VGDQPLLDPSSVEFRIGVAWRELRRGAVAQAVRNRLYGDVLEPAQLDALDVLDERGGRCRMSELADALRVDASTMTRTAGRLVRAGYVRRVKLADDGRVVILELTRKGRVLLQQLQQRRIDMLFDVLADMSGPERAQLADLLERLVAGLDRYADGDRAAASAGR
jgi:DNA-binding MarR family transcriptional regulator